jgi:hypothetical protein
MVARPGTYSASANAGEMDPRVWGRSDIKQFYSGMSLMQNCEPVPQGGFRKLPGTTDVGTVRGPLTVAGGLFTVFPGPTTGPAVVAQLELPANSRISIAELAGLSASVNVTGVLQLQTSLDNANWSDFGAPVNATPVARTRQRGLPPGSSVLARYVRLRLVAAVPAPVTFALAGFRAFVEAATPPAVARAFEFTFAINQAYHVVLTPGHADFYEGDVWNGSCALPVTAQQLPDIKREQRLLTMYLWHPDLQPLQLVRSTVDADWRSEPAPFENIPNNQYELSYNNAVNDVWNITIRWSSGPAELALELTVNGEDTEAVTLGVGPPNPNWPQFLIDLQAAIEGLPSVSPGIVLTQTLTSTSTVIRVEFAGTGNAGSRFTMAARINNVTFAAATVSHPRFGDPGGEPIMSAARGWPVTGQFYQDRLYQAGFRSEPGALLGSVTGEYYDLNTKIESASGGILARLDTSGAERIEHLVRARHLVIFTNEAEYYITDRAIVRTTPPNVAESSRYGVAPSIKPVENEGGLLYVARSRAQIYAANYSDVSQKYDSEPMSLLASHLVQGIRSMAIERASDSTDAARVYLPRDDGLMAVAVLIRNQEVSAFVRFVTDGNVLDACVDGAGRVFLLVDRPCGAGRRLFRERLDDNALMHQETTRVFTTPQTVVTGLERYEGRTVWVSADGYFDKSHVVTGGQIILPYAATTVTVGRWTPPRARLLPLPRMVAERTHLARPVRVHTVRARLAGATSMAIAANGGAARDVPLVHAGEVSDQPVPPFSGSIAVTGLAGYSDEGFVEFTQTRPGRFGVRDITVEARS